jgi:hypothetical protein
MGASAIRIGKLWVPGRQAEAALANYTKQTFCLTGHEQCPYAFLGSATALRFADKCFVLWCKYQTRDYAPNDVTIPIKGGTILVSGSRLLFATEDHRNADEDFAAFYLFGYPTELRSVDYELPHVQVRQVVTSAEYNGASHARHLHSLRFTGKKSFTQDGLSGGPVYHVARKQVGLSYWPSDIVAADRISQIVR